MFYGYRGPFLSENISSYPFVQYLFFPVDINETKQDNLQVGSHLYLSRVFPCHPEQFLFFLNPVPDYIFISATLLMVGVAAISAGQPTGSSGKHETYRFL